MGRDRSALLRARGAHASFAAAVLWCAMARAHGPTEVFQVVSSEPTDVVLATSRGLVFGTFAPRAWSLACSEGFGLESGERYQLARLSSGRLLLAARSGGLRYSDDRACTWRPLPALAGRPAPLLAQHPYDPDRLYVIVEHEGASALQLSRDGGATFEAQYTLPNAAAVRSLLVTSSSRAGAELYLSAIEGPPYSPTGHFVARSIDGTDEWERFAVALLPGELDVTLLAAAPGGALIARASAREPSRGERLLYSRDGGASFTPWGSVRILRAAAFGEDGAAYAAGVDGVMRIALDTGAVSPARGAWMHLIQQRAEGLFVAGYHAGIEAQWNGLAWLDAEADSFAPFMSFYEVSEQIRCPDLEREQRCAPLLADYLREHPAPSPPPMHVLPRPLDAGAWPGTDAGRSAGDDGSMDGPDATLSGEADDTPDRTMSDAGSPWYEIDAASTSTGGDSSQKERAIGGCSLGGYGAPLSSWLGAALLAIRRRRRR